MRAPLTTLGVLFAAGCALAPLARAQAASAPESDPRIEFTLLLSTEVTADLTTDRFLPPGPCRTLLDDLTHHLASNPDLINDPDLHVGLVISLPRPAARDDLDSPDLRFGIGDPDPRAALSFLRNHPGIRRVITVTVDNPELFGDVGALPPEPCTEVMGGLGIVVTPTAITALPSFVIGSDG